MKDGCFLWWDLWKLYFFILGHYVVKLCALKVCMYPQLWITEFNIDLIIHRQICNQIYLFMNNYNFELGYWVKMV